MASNLTKRIAFAVIAIPALLGVAYLGGWYLTLLLSAAGALAAREIYDFARRQGIEPLGVVGTIGAALMPVMMALPLLAPGRAAIMVREGHWFAAGLLLLLTLTLWRRGTTRRPLTAAAVTLFGVMYASWLPSFALMLRHPLPGTFANDASVGMALLFYPLVLTWVGDTVAMTAGRTFGGPKMAPVVSPNKTWSGGIGGLLGSIAVSVIWGATVFQRAGIAMTWLELVIFGAIIGVAGQVGDVVESMFKREVGVKDSSAIIPGHGGVLDRLDSQYFAIPAAALLFKAWGIVS